MILLVLIIFMISLMFIAKAPVLNKWAIFLELSYLKGFILRGNDTFKLNMGKYHVGNELIVLGENIKHQSTNSHTINYKINLSRFINHQQSSESTAA